MKKQETPSLVISSRAAMIRTVGDIVTAKLRHAELTARMEQEIAAIRQRHHERLTTLAQEIQSKQAGVQSYCEQHRSTEFSEKKSLDLEIATIGFRETPYRVEKARAKDTWEEIAARMAAITTRDAQGQPVFTGEQYLTYSQPTLAKSLLLQHRPKIPEQVLKAAGIRFTNDELFYITPRSHVARAAMEEAA